MDFNVARKAMAEQYKVSPDDLAMGPVWDLPEVGRRFLMFEIRDPNHRQFRSTLCYDISVSAKLG